MLLNKLITLVKADGAITRDDSASPHFYFRATIVYAILRSKGVPLGIADYIGRVKTTPSSRFSAEIHQHTGDQYLEFLEQLAGPQVENL